jgi:tetratricopeptide (TPR) repeat protein
LKATEPGPAFAEGFLQAGRIYIQEKRLQDELRKFEAAVKAEPENAQALFNLASVYANMGDKQKAQSLFSQA